MDKNSIQYLLGIDGGGTKTEFLLTDLHKNECARVVLGSSNPVNAGIEKAKAILSLGITQLCAGKDRSAISVFAGLAGGRDERIKNDINRFLSQYGFGAFANGSDTDSTLELALHGADGVAVIMGTGIVAFTKSGNKLHRTGGWGYMIDQGGSGFHYGADALHCALSYHDKSGGSALMLQLVEDKLGKGIETCIPDIYAQGVAFVASFAPIVFQAYSIGDDFARQIIDRNVREAAKIINAARKQLENDNAPTVICGGLCKEKDILLPFLHQYTDPTLPLSFSDEPTVNGAISLAKSNIQGGAKPC